jgi:hypothetical protein
LVNTKCKRLPLSLKKKLNPIVNGYGLHFEYHFWIDNKTCAIIAAFGVSKAVVHLSEEIAKLREFVSHQTLGLLTINTELGCFVFIIAAFGLNLLFLDT